MKFRNPRRLFLGIRKAFGVGYVIRQRYILSRFLSRSGGHVNTTHRNGDNFDRTSTYKFLYQSAENKADVEIQE